MRTPIQAAYMRMALRLAGKGYGMTSPNPAVGAVLLKQGRTIGGGWHHRAGQPHAEIEALRDAQRRGHNTRGATLYVTLEPCCTHGRTPPCTDAILAAGIKTVVAGATDPNPRHSGKGFEILRRAGIQIVSGVLGEECNRLNEAFNHWIVHGTPFVTVKAAMTLDGKIATASGESKWITSQAARDYGMKLRLGTDAVLVGVNTVLADDPSLTFRTRKEGRRERGEGVKKLRRIILDSLARTPVDAKVVSDNAGDLTTIVVSESAARKRVAALSKRVRVLLAPAAEEVRLEGSRFSRNRVGISLPWLLKHLGAENVTGLLVEGGGEVSASFLFGGLAQRVAFFYAPKILGGRDAVRAVGGAGAGTLAQILSLRQPQWRKVGTDWLMTARLQDECAGLVSEHSCIADRRGHRLAQRSCALL